MLVLQVFLCNCASTYTAGVLHPCMFSVFFLYTNPYYKATKKRKREKIQGELADQSFSTTDPAIATAECMHIGKHAVQMLIEDVDHPSAICPTRMSKPLAD